MGWVNCSHCKEGLLKADGKSGVGHLRYGKAKKPNKPHRNGGNSEERYNPIDVFIMGTVKMRCPKCGGWNLLSFFPCNNVLTTEMPTTTHLGGR